MMSEVTDVAGVYPPDGFWWNSGTDSTSRFRSKRVSETYYLDWGGKPTVTYDLAVLQFWRIVGDDKWYGSIIPHGLTSEPIHDGIQYFEDFDLEALMHRLLALRRLTIGPLTHVEY